ncbi:MAG: ATP-binding protein [Clostridium sp.]|nr:ATP-binding protein [Clostridium sp.]
MNGSIHRMIMGELEARRRESSYLLESRRKEIYNKIPRVEEIEQEIRLSGIKYNKEILSGTKSADKAADELLERVSTLRQEKERLLAEHSYDSDFLEPKFECKLCGDTGFFENDEGIEKCTCYRQKYINLLFSQSNLKLLEEENFALFNEGYYPTNIDEKKYGIRISPRENIIRIRDRALNFIDNLDNPKDNNLFFCGPTGVGKTFMINCIAAELLKRGRAVLYQTAPSLFKVINDYKIMAFRDSLASDKLYSDIFEVELLIIDDLGTESPTAARYAELLNILTTRQKNNLASPCKTIISTNLGINELREYYDERVASRIIGNFDLFKFVGQDIRVLKKMEQS